ncbi:MAG: DUF3307 domain-containing protein [Candidatus Omnitrophota bacterium]|nr:DUF3307 domain-containing protein [Candidatus Omnitrophota bacterium]
MFLFLKLCLAHMIGDFILQFDELYKLKVKRVLGHFLHVAIHYIVTMLLVFPYLQFTSMWFYVFFLCMLHYLQDRLKYRLQQNQRIMFPCFVTDQFFHFLWITGAFLLPASRLRLGVPEYPLLDTLYSHDAVTLILLLFIGVTFGYSYLAFTFRRSFIPSSRPDHGISSFEMSHGLVERGLVAGVFVFATNPLWMIAAPMVGLLRLTSPKLRDKSDFLSSFSVAALMGLLFRLWI